METRLRSAREGGWGFAFIDILRRFAERSKVELSCGGAGFLTHMGCLG